MVSAMAIVSLDSKRRYTSRRVGVSAYAATNDELVMQRLLEPRVQLISIESNAARIDARSSVGWVSEPWNSSARPREHASAS